MGFADSTKATHAVFKGLYHCADKSPEFLFAYKATEPLQALKIVQTYIALGN